MSMYTKSTKCVVHAPPSSDPEKQKGWDEANLAMAWRVFQKSVIHILRALKGPGGKFKYSYAEAKLDDMPMEDLVDKIHQELDLRDKIHGKMWASGSEILFSEEMARDMNPEFWKKHTFPSKQGQPVEFHMAGSIGKAQIRELINSRVLPECGLSDYVFYSYPAYERWFENKHWDQDSDEYGFLLKDGKKIQQKKEDQDNSGRPIYRWDVSLKPKK